MVCIMLYGKGLLGLSVIWNIEVSAIRGVTGARIYGRPFEAVRSMDVTLIGKKRLLNVRRQSFLQVRIVLCKHCSRKETV